MEVLIVDDERTAQKNLARVLSKVTENAHVQMTEQAEEAVSLCRDFDFDVVFLDINMPDKDGLTLAKEIKEIRPMINIVIVTAYPEHALKAYKLYVSDYIMKPVVKEDLRNALCNLRNPVRQNRKGLYVQCFGNFMVTFDGEVVSFGREKTKELFAYLVSRRGAAVTTGELCSVLWEDDTNLITKKAYIRTYYATLKKEFEAVGHGDVLVHSRNSYAVNIGSIDCDYYQYLKGDPKAAYLYQSEFMSQYSWAETMIYDIDTQKR